MPQGRWITSADQLQARSATRPGHRSRRQLVRVHRRSRRPPRVAHPLQSPSGASTMDTPARCLGHRGANRHHCLRCRQTVVVRRYMFALHAHRWLKKPSVKSAVQAAYTAIAPADSSARLSVRRRRSAPRRSASRPARLLRYPRSCRGRRCSVRSRPHCAPARVRRCPARVSRLRHRPMTRHRPACRWPRGRGDGLLIHRLWRWWRARSRSHAPRVRTAIPARQEAAGASAELGIVPAVELVRALMVRFLGDEQGQQLIGALADLPMDRRPRHWVTEIVKGSGPGLNVVVIGIHERTIDVEDDPLDHTTSCCGCASGHGRHRWTASAPLTRPCQPPRAGAGSRRNWSPRAAHRRAVRWTSSPT